MRLATSAPPSPRAALAARDFIALRPSPLPLRPARWHRDCEIPGAPTHAMPKIETLHDLLIEELKDLYSAETQLVKALPKMAKAASDERLKEGFQKHLAQTQEQVSRLDQIAKILEFTPKGKKCLAMEGLVAEGSEKISDDASDSVRDAALICAAQKIEHYEIAGYGTLREFAELLGYDEVRALLEATLEEESAADEELTEIASSINIEAEQGIESDE